MKNASALYDELRSFVSQCSWSDQRHMYVLIWMVIGLLQEGSVNLTRWLCHVETEACYAQSTQRRFSRWLHNIRIHPGSIYRNLIHKALSGWEDKVLYLSFDPTMLWDRYCVMRLSVVYRGRAVPVIWRVLEHGSSSVKFHQYRDLLDAAAEILPAGVKIVFLADRGFGCHRLMRYLRQELHWYYHIRLKSDNWICRGKKGWKQLNQFHLKPGEALMLHHVTLYKGHSVEDVHLAMAKEERSGNLWLLVSSEPTSLQTLQEYGMRFDIEESFLDDKSNGFEWENSGLRCPIALSRLCLVMATATLFLTLQGTAVVEAKKRRWVDPHWFRGMSYFKIGWNWVKAALTRGWEFFPIQSLTSNIDPEPPKASLAQYDFLCYRLEFQVFTLSYDT